MTRYPVLFSFRDLIAGNGFVAGVAVHGRALLIDEGDGFWMYGVNPGGVAAGGQTPNEAQAEFRKGYRTVLFDAAAEAPDFESFRREIEAFFEETNSPTEKEWEDAVQDVRDGKVVADWLSAKPAESLPMRLDVVLLEHPEPRLNELDHMDLAA
jgi:hypothetical protein